MIDKKKAVSHVYDLTGSIIARSKKEEKALRELRELLVNAIAREPDFSLEGMLVEQQQIDPLTGIQPEKTASFKDIESLVEQIAKKPPPKKEKQYRIFRRISPLINVQVPGSVPNWAKGTKIGLSYGPFESEEGLLYWFDFYLITETKLIAIYFDNLTGEPCILLPLKVPTPASRRKNYTIDTGSIWIRSTFFVPDAPSGYIGLTINGGRLSLSQATDLANGDMILPSASTIELDLELIQPYPPEPSNDTYGIDAKQSELDLPSSCELIITNHALSINALSPARWKLYKDDRTFSYDENANNSFSKLLDGIERILIPCLTSSVDFEITKEASLSEFNNLSGKSNVVQGAWTLPITKINTSAPPEADGIGALALNCAKGITSKWLGLSGGKIELGTVWFLLKPGEIAVASESSSNIYAHQKYKLWANEVTGYNAEATLKYTDSFPFYYLSSNSGIENVFTRTNAEIRTDRPVRVNGQPFEIKVPDCILFLGASSQVKGLWLYEKNYLSYLFETKVLKDVLEIHALALNNALLTLTEPVSFSLSGELESESVLRSGALDICNWLYYITPTLPDPYASNLSLWIALQSRANISRQIIALTHCSIRWPIDENPKANVEVSFKLRSLGDNNNSINISQVQARQAAASQMVAARDIDENVAGRNNYSPSEFEDPWQSLIYRLGIDFFALLDVSTKADLMGVAYGFFDEEYLLRRTHLVAGNEPVVPLIIEGMDLKASGKYVRAFMSPQISWEPVFNLSDIKMRPTDPPTGFLEFPNDGGPTRIFNNSHKTVALAPIPVANFLLDEFENDDKLLTVSQFTLPFGLQAIARINKENQIHPGDPGSDIKMNTPEFPDEITGGLQIKATGALNKNESNRVFQGNTIQLTNLISSQSGPSTILGENTTRIFNNVFSPGGQNGQLTKKGVPVERIDFSGYGSSMFSSWKNNKAEFAQTSQAKFDVWLGRTAHEIIQVRSIIYPWGIRVVRTISMFRVSSAFVYRLDSGWRAESDGIYDFSFTVQHTNVSEIRKPYNFHPGAVKGVFNVRNIQETTNYIDYMSSRSIRAGEASLNENGIVAPVTSEQIGKSWDIELSPVYFTADVAIDFVKEGKINGRVPSKKMLGFIQIKPAGVPIPRDVFDDLLRSYPDIGGDVDCVIDIGQSGQLMRVSRVEINPSRDNTNNPIFVGVAKGAPILPADGSWGIVQQNHRSGEVTSINDHFGIPLIREGEWVRGNDGNWSADATQAGKALRLADARELIRQADNATVHFGFLQNTGTQKVLFRLPNFQENERQLFSQDPDFVDAYHLLNSKSIFPNLENTTDALELAAKGISVNISDTGYQLGRALEQALPPGPWYWVGSAEGKEPVKIYLKYSIDNTPSKLNFNLDSQAKNWTSIVKDTSIVVDIGPLKEAFVIKGDFSARKGAHPSIDNPKMEFGNQLDKVKNVLQILESISTNNYAQLAQKSFEVAFSNTPEEWEYKFHATKQIPVLRFPPVDSPAAPLKLEASLLVGCYFNETLKITTDFKQLIPSAGGFVEFYAQLSVMCVSIALATIYAVGQAKLAMYADLKKGARVSMRFGFGVELAVGLPVIGSVSVMYLVGIEMDLSEDGIRVSAFLMFMGRAEILGGIVTITIMIEAKGSIERLSTPGDGKTNMIAQVTFGLDIHIFLVIDISFEKTWQERRQIA